MSKIRHRITVFALAFLLAGIAGAFVCARNVPVVAADAAAEPPISVTKAMVRADPGRFTFGLEFDAADAPFRDALQLNDAFREHIAVNGVPLTAIDPAYALTYVNMEKAGFDSFRQSMLTPDGSAPSLPSADKLWIYFSFANDIADVYGSHLLQNNSTNVFTIKRGFPIGSLAATPTAQTLDRDYSYRALRASEASDTVTYLKACDAPVWLSQVSEELFSADRTTVGDGAVYTAASEIETSQAAGGHAFGSDRNANIQMVAGTARAVDASDWNTDALALSFWVYTEKTSEELLAQAGHGIELSSSVACDAPDEYEWHATDIYFSPFFKTGLWNRIILKLTNARQQASAPDFSSLRFFRQYWLPTTEWSETPVYFADFRIVEAPGTCYSVVDTRPVVQYVSFEPAEEWAVGVTQALSATAETRIPGQPAGTAFVYESSDPTVLSVDGDLATAHREGSVTLVARLAGDAQRAAAVASAAVAVTATAKRPQAPIYIDSPATHTYGTDYIFSVRGGTTDGAVTYRISPTGTTGEGAVAGNVLRVTRVGTFRVDAVMTGNDEFLDVVTTEAFTLTVQPRVLTVRIDDATAEQFGAIPAFAARITEGALAESDTLDSLGLAYYCSATGVEAGKFNIVAEANTPNYAVTVVKGVLTVRAHKKEQAPLNFNCASEALLGDPFLLTAAGGSTLNPIVYEIDAAHSTVAATLTNGRLDVTAAGTVAVIARRAGNDIFEDTESEPFLIRFEKRRLTVTVSDASVVLGAQLPSFGYTVTEGSLAAGDTLEVRFDVPEVTEAGEYKIGAQATASRDIYEIAVVEGTLTVTPAIEEPDDGGAGGCAGCKGSIGVGSAMLGGAGLTLAAILLSVRKKRGKED